MVNVLAEYHCRNATDKSILQQGENKLISNAGTSMKN
jgi:hypothetical protein